MDESDKTLVAACMLLIINVLNEQPNKRRLADRVCRAIREETGTKR